MIKFLINLFKKEKFHIIHTELVAWAAPPNMTDVVWRVTVLFEMGDKGSRRVSYENRPKRGSVAEEYYNIENSFVYHSFVVPYLSRSGMYSMSNEDFIKTHFSPPAPAEKEPLVKEGNVITFPKSQE